MGLQNGLFVASELVNGLSKIFFLDLRSYFACIISIFSCVLASLKEDMFVRVPPSVDGKDFFS